MVLGTSRTCALNSGGIGVNFEPTRDGSLTQFALISFSTSAYRLGFSAR